MKYLLILSFLLTACSDADFMKTYPMSCSIYQGSGNRVTVCDLGPSICYHWNDGLSCVRK